MFAYTYFPIFKFCGLNQGSQAHQVGYPRPQSDPCLKKIRTKGEKKKGVSKKLLLKETPIPRGDPHPLWCWRWSQGVLHVRHAFYHRPSLIALFSIPSILTFAQNLHLQHFYNMIIDMSHSFPLQNQFLNQDNLFGKFLFVFL